MHGISAGYRLADKMFTRSLMKTFSWAGGSKAKGVHKKPFKSLEHVQNLIFDLVKRAAPTFNRMSMEKFWKENYLPNTKRRAEKPIRAAATKLRSKGAGPSKRKPSKPKSKMPRSNGDKSDSSASSALEDDAGRDDDAPEKTTPSIEIDNKTPENEPAGSSDCGASFIDSMLDIELPILPFDILGTSVPTIDTQIDAATLAQETVPVHEQDEGVAANESIELDGEENDDSSTGDSETDAEEDEDCVARMSVSISA